MAYLASPDRYQTMLYRASGRSGLKLPAVSLGLWHNFGGVDTFENARDIACAAFDLGITHFDLANNYGPPPGSAEETFGRILARDLAPHRDELIISTKAGYRMWPGPYGDFGSRKFLVASLDQSLGRLGLPYVDIFYHHRPDPETPLEETMGALDHIVRSGKALYVGVSNYPPELVRRAAELLRQLGTPCLIHQPAYNMFQRDPETGLLPELETQGIGCIAFSPLAQGQLTDRYLKGLPPDSRAVKSGVFLNARDITESKLAKIRALDAVAKGRGQSLAQMALAWALRHQAMTSVLVGASRRSQVVDNVAALANLGFDASELAAIDRILAG
jgi:L-glyceraldehyde 3-phosphate reductase